MVRFPKTPSKVAKVVGDSVLLIEAGDIACMRKVDFLPPFFFLPRLFQKRRLIDDDPPEEDLWKHFGEVRPIGDKFGFSLEGFH